jgi:hypothetical protein
MVARVGHTATERAIGLIVYFWRRLADIHNGLEQIMLGEPAHEGFTEF